ncbi:MAG: hypothetical protein A3K03_03690 [Bdellovibrionales bacterium RIFOXYD1_FULL_44_7]|nr:MAG: hypothetical protein A3K03_03690 [Bdellovibrionales bacterium RIFOXYD1_FULL_44_7]
MKDRFIRISKLLIEKLGPVLLKTFEFIRTKLKGPYSAPVRKALVIGSYVLSVWLSIAFIGYGLALNAHQEKMLNQQGGVFSESIIARSRTLWGFVGPVCFTILRGNEFCIKKRYLAKNSPGLRAIWDDLAPGTSVWMKTYGEIPVELIVNNRTPDAKTIVSWTDAYPKARQDLETRIGSVIALLGFAFVPLTAFLHLYWLPRRKRVRPLNQ